MAGKLEFVLKLPIVKVIDKKEAENYIPHREPFMLFDEARVHQDEKYISGSKLFSGKEDFFKGHFPTHPVVAIEVLRVGRVTKLYCEAYTKKGLCSEAQLNFIVGDK